MGLGRWDGLVFFWVCWFEFVWLLDCLACLFGLFSWLISQIVA